MDNNEKLDKKMPTKEEILSKIEEIRLKTKDRFTNLLISHLEDNLNKTSNAPFIEFMEFERIKNLFEKEKRRGMIESSLKVPKKEQVYVFKITLAKDIWRVVEIKGSTLFSKFSGIIQGIFGHEPGHLYEFELNKYKFGPECDEWQEIFDSLDDIRSDSAFNSISFKVGGNGKFKYDFGEDIEYTIKLVEIRDLEKDAKYPKIKGNKEAYKCENCKLQDAMFYCHGYEMKLCEACSESILKDSGSCIEGYYPLLSIFQDSKSYWT